MLESIKQYAIIADIHGNVWALDAVLQDIARRKIQTILNLGDHVYGSLDPAGVMQRLMQSHILSISGNQERVLLDASDEVQQSADYRFVHGELSQAQLDWFAALPQTCVVDDLFLCHGTPESDETYLLETVTPQGVFLKSSSEIMRHLQGIAQPVILCGHSHVARIVHLPDGRLVVNPGSVGIPAYDHDLPYAHVMESGSPHARYALLTKSANGWSIEQVALAYDWATPARIARQRGRPDRAKWIETGRV